MIRLMFAVGAVLSFFGTYTYGDAYIKAGEKATQAQLVVFIGSGVLTMFLVSVLTFLIVKYGDLEG